MSMQKTAVPFHGTPEQETKLRESIAKHKEQQGALLPVLQEAQKLYGYLPVEVQKIIGEDLNLPLSQVAGTLSFYSLFTTEKPGQYVLRICKSAPCYVKGAAATLEALEDILGVKAGETTADGKFTLVTTECLGICDRSPAVMVNGKVYGPIHAGDVAKFLEQFE